MKSYTLDDLARMIDHTNLHTDASPKDMEVLCNEAKEHHFAMVAINQVQSGLCAKLLEGTDIHTGVNIRPCGEEMVFCMEVESEDDLNSFFDKTDQGENEDGIWKFTFTIKKAGEK